MVSPGSEYRDYTEKLEEYLAFGVKEYWIIDLEEQHIIVFRLSRGRRIYQYVALPPATRHYIGHVQTNKAKAIVDFVNGPQSFPSFADILARTVEHNPTRSEPSLRRGILHNAHQLPDGSWAWRYDRAGRVGAPDEETMPRVDNVDYWDDVSALTVPVFALLAAAALLASGLFPWRGWVAPSSRQT